MGGKKIKKKKGKFFDKLFTVFFGSGKFDMHMRRKKPGGIFVKKRKCEKKRCPPRDSLKRVVGKRGDTRPMKTNGNRKKRGQEEK